MPPCRLPSSLPMRGRRGDSSEVRNSRLKTRVPPYSPALYVVSRIPKGVGGDLIIGAIVGFVEPMKDEGLKSIVV